MWAFLVHSLQHLLALITSLGVVVFAFFGTLRVRKRQEKQPDRIAAGGAASEEREAEAPAEAMETAPADVADLSRADEALEDYHALDTLFESRARPSEQARRSARYANAVLLHEGQNEPLSKEQPLQVAQTVRLRLDIGPLSAESQVSHPEVFPDAKLPEIDIDLDVMVSSTDFAVAAKDVDEPGIVAHGHLKLPRDGGPATTHDGGKYLFFRLTAPDRNGTARARIGYYYRNVLVQSQLLQADIGEGEGFSIETDYTMSKDFRVALTTMPDRPRISILTNDNGDGRHQIILRRPGKTEGNAHSFTVDSRAVGGTVTQMRRALAFNAPTTKQRRRAQLIEDLKTLAPLGWELYGQVPGQRPQFFFNLSDHPEDFVIQVTRPSSSGFAFPWGLIYEIQITSNVTPEVCRLVDEWNGSDPLFTGDQRTCPYGPHSKDVLCPFGFWGFRYAIDQISSTDEAAYTIPMTEDPEFAMGETQYQVTLSSLAQHVRNLAASLKKARPGGVLKEAKTRGDVETLISHDLPLVYFYCHGERDPRSSATYLGVGQNDSISALDLIGLVKNTRPWFWNAVRPLVFINACHSLEITPQTLVSYLDAFVGTAQAAGVIGTEVKVQQDLAMRVAEAFFEAFLAGKTVEQSLRAIRMDYLSSGNLFGLVYTPYCWSELKLVPAP